jgi:hypothetical protein
LQAKVIDGVRADGTGGILIEELHEYRVDFSRGPTSLRISLGMWYEARKPRFGPKKPPPTCQANSSDSWCR